MKRAFIPAPARKLATSSASAFTATGVAGDAARSAAAVSTARASGSSASASRRGGKRAGALATAPGVPRGAPPRTRSWSSRIASAASGRAPGSPAPRARSTGPGGPSMEHPGLASGNSPRWEPSIVDKPRGRCRLRVRGDNGGDRPEQLPAQRLALHGEPPTLVIGQPETAATEVAPEARGSPLFGTR